MLSVPTVAQMLGVIGATLLAVALVTAGLTVVLDRLTRRTADGLNAGANGRLTHTEPAPARVTVPGQRAATHDHPVAH